MGKVIKKHLGKFLFVLIGVVLIMTYLYFINQYSNTHFTNDMQIEKKRYELSSIYWMIGVIGGCISTTLCYVGYKKYRAQTKKSKKYNS